MQEAVCAPSLPLKPSDIKSLTVSIVSIVQFLLALVWSPPTPEKVLSASLCSASDENNQTEPKQVTLQGEKNKRVS